MSSALGAANAHDASSSERDADDRDATNDDRRTSVERAKAKLDVLSCSLDRREFHADCIHDAIDAIHLYTDASPTTGLEMQGMVADVYKKQDHATYYIASGHFALQLGGQYHEGRLFVVEHMDDRGTHHG